MADNKNNKTVELDDEQLGEVSGGTATVNEDPTIVHT
ncbi:hypothetical protein SAMN05216463_13418 [Xylanibacter ruminicola]|uniref:Uncharacterized protein n=1 Tax=Xylanibacter ruminicola TaxID=839 RepID=A0A1M6YXC4_XYLRU|nr:hypothetical protein SAMN05216463_13418 [Xylanibacter ruminicola]